MTGPIHRSKSIYKVVIIATINDFTSGFLKPFNFNQNQTFLLCSWQNLIQGICCIFFSNPTLCSKDNYCDNSYLASCKFFLWKWMSKWTHVPTMGVPQIWKQNKQTNKPVSHDFRNCRLSNLLVLRNLEILPFLNTSCHIKCWSQVNCQMKITAEMKIYNKCMCVCMIRLYCV